MKQIDKEILALLDKYGADLKRALKENKKLEYLYAISELRENLLEWYEFRKEASLLQIGADYGALTGLFAHRLKEVTVLDEQQESLDVVKARFKDAVNIRCVVGSLESIAASSASPSFAAESQAECERYDYVTLIGSLKEPYDTQIERAKALLKPDGTLLVAACNTLGLKYFTGAPRDSNGVTKKELIQLLPGGSFYYPMPDYRVPSAIYSDAYLPKKGDLTKTLAAYGYPGYLAIDVGAYYDVVCGDGQFDNFANSYLVIWKKGEQA